MQIPLSKCGTSPLDSVCRPCKVCRILLQLILIVHYAFSYLCPLLVVSVSIGVNASPLLFTGPNKHQSAVTCLQFNRRFVITSSDDGTVKIWDLRTGEFLRNLVTLSSGGSGGVVWRLRYNNTKLVCAVGSRNGTEETKVMVFDFDVEDSNSSNAAAIA